jgi:hypothetical protein
MSILDAPGRRAAVLGPIAAVLLSAGCLVAESDLYLPTHRPMNAMPDGLVEGVLLEAGGCLWIEDADDARMLVLGPPGTTARQDEAGLAIDVQGEVLRLGMRISAGGGQYQAEHQAFVHDLIGEAVPEPCRATGMYWLAGNVSTLDP